MNRTYALVWNHCLGAWTVANEHARRRGKGAGAVLAAALLLPITALAADLPTGGQVVSGSGQIGTPANNQLVIDQASGKLAINWQSFDIGAGHKVTFNQPGTDSIALNRVLGADGSKIMGQLDANGRVFIINPNGVLFGQGAQVNVGGLVASTLDISNGDFEAGNYQFKGNGSNASVINNGQITAAGGGAVALLGGTVSNNGVIVANQGSVALTAGNKVTLDFAGDGLLNVQVDEAVVDALVANHKLIKANGGQVLLTADAGEALLKTVVNNTGVIEAQTLGEKDGKIVLLGSFDGGSVQVAGTLDASAANGGNGGFIETSGAHVKVANSAKVTTKAQSGKTGTWLIDPNDFTVAATGGDMSGAAVSAAVQNNNFEIQTATMGTAGGNGDIHINDAITWSSDNTLTLTAERNININTAITATGAAAGLELNYAGTDYNVTAPVTLSGASATLAINGNAYTLIHNATDLAAIGSGYYALAENLDLSSNSYTSAVINSLSGTLAGLGHTISNLTIIGSSTNAGLIGTVQSGSEVRDLGLLGGSVTGDSDVGALAARNDGSIHNTYATSTVNGRDNVGGLVGTNTGSISNAYATGTVNGRDTIGGLVGANSGSGSISNAYATGSATGSGNFVGGLAGSNGGGISTAYATGSVHANGSRAGGLVGVNDGNITNAYASGSASATALFGALVGYESSGTISNSYGINTTQLKSVAFWQSVWGTTIDDAGGTGAAWRIYDGHTAPLLRSFLKPLTVTSTLGYDGTGAALGNIASVTWDTGSADTSHIFVTGSGDTLTLRSTEADSYTATSNTRLYSDSQQGYDIIGGTATRTISTPGSAVGDIQLPSSITWNTGTLVIDTNGSLSTVGANGALVTAINGDIFNLVSGTWAQNAAMLANFSVTDFRLDGGSFLRVTGGDGSEGDEYQIADVYGLQGIGSSPTYLAASWVLAGDLDASGAANWSAGKGFDPIGDDTHTFTGTFDGAGHVITGLTINRADENYVGLFGYTGSGSLVGNVGMEGGTVRGGSSVGGLVGYNASGTISNAYATGNVSGNDNIGGLVGYNDSGSIDDAYATGSVSGGSNVGGLAGFNTGTISNAYATGSVGGNDNVGGLVGYNGGDISNAYAMGSVSGSGKAGGLVGRNGSGHISNVYATGNVIADANANAYFNATATAYAGGLVGYNDSGTIGNAYATGNVSADADADAFGFFGANANATANAGGLVGYNDSGSIGNAYATGNVTAAADAYASADTDSYATANANAGGLVGYNASGNIGSTYATGNAIGNASANADAYFGGSGASNHVYAGGLVGVNTGATTSSFYATTDSNGNIINNGGASNPHGTGKTWVGLSDPDTYVGWDTSIWTLPGLDASNPGYSIALPYLTAVTREVDIVRVPLSSAPPRDETRSNPSYLAVLASNGQTVSGEAKQQANESEALTPDMLLTTPLDEHLNLQVINHGIRLPEGI